MKKINAFVQKNTTPFSAKTVLFLALLAITTPALAQTTWTGATDTDWATPSNWSDGVPDPAIEAIIPDVANDPVIVAAASAESVTVQSGAVLTIVAAASLTINGSSAQGILNQGTVENSGTLNFGQTTGTEQFGIFNTAIFNNNTGGQINIDRSTFNALVNYSGTFTNMASITIGSVASVGTYGISNYAAFNNNTGGQIKIDRSTSIALVNNPGGTFTNMASITIGSVASMGDFGISNNAAFNNNTGGQINIDRSIASGIWLDSGPFSNAGTITIGALVPITNLMISSSGTFSNNAGGVLKGTGTLPAAAFTHAGGQLAPGYSPGRMSFNGAENFSNCILAMEVAGGADFDQVVVTSGAATVGTNTFLNLVFSYAATDGATFDILTASSITGTIPPDNIAFSNTGAGNVTGVSVSYPAGKVRVTVSTASIWTGAAGTDWATAANWSAGVPSAANVVIIPNVTNNPTISTAAFARSVTVQSGAVLTIAAAGTLTMNGSVTQGVLNQGTVENNGTLNIGQSANTGLYGIYNESVFNNNTGGQIKIDRTTGTNSASIYNFTGGTFTNAATITIGALVSSQVNYGIRNESVFNNNTGGQISIDRWTHNGLYNVTGGTFTNVAGITIGALVANGGDYGIWNNAAFNNNTGGQINIDRSRIWGLYNFTGGTFINAAAITIGAAASVGNYGIWNNAAFNNNTGGQIKIDRWVSAGLYNVNGGTFTNAATTTIGALASTGLYGIFNESTFNNNTGGQINIDRSTDTGLYNNTGGIFTNETTITIGAVASVGTYGLQNKAAFNNNTGGQINIDRSTSVGLYNLTGGTFTNETTLTIGAVASVGTYGIQNFATFNNDIGGQINIDRSTTSGIYLLFGASTFPNAATITIGALVPMTNLMTSSSSGTFSNNTGGVLKGTGTLPAVAFIHAGGRLAPGYSPGKMTFSGAEDFSNSILAMEVAGGGGVGGTDFDQVVVTSGAATVGTNTILNLVFSYAATDGATFDILTASSITGTIPPANISFSNTGAGNVTAVTVSYPAGIVRVTVSTVSTWTGATNTDWATPSNWSAGVPGAASVAIIPNVTNDPTISAEAFARTITVQSGAVLTIAAAGTLTIDGSPTQGILNQGTVQNSGTLNIGQTTGTGLYGIQNNSTFNNNTGGQIKIDRSTTAGLYNFNGGIFTNRSTITIGAVASVGTYGIQNNSTFSNNTGGQINIDRATTSGILLNANAFSNAATTTIGALVPITNLMTRISGTFINNTGGVLKGAGTLVAAAFIHSGGQLAPGYSPGKMTFDAAEDFSNSILAMEVAGGGGVGGADFDQVVVTSGAATLGTNTTLNLVFSYATTEGATFDILTAGSISGTIPLAKISFSNTGAGNVTSMIVSYPAGKVRVTVSTATTWTGATGTDWATATNWTNGVPDATQIATIPNVTNDPTIGSAAFARTITVQSGAVLSIAAATTLTIDGSSTQGILNQGTVENSGTLRIGQTTGTGLYGILNQSVFNNNTGGQIRIDRSTGTNSAGIYNFTGGTFTNMATITIGAVVATGGTYGIQNIAAFNNNTGGQINIDRSTGTNSAGIYNFTGGTFTNIANITIGAAASVGTYGVLNNNATFNNNTGGQINIDRSTLYGLYNSGTFTNVATITIGAAAASVGTGIYNSKTFNNNTGGQIKIDRSTSIGIWNFSAGNFTNVATITIGAGGNVGSYGIANEAVFNNNTGGQINIDRSTSIGLYNLNAGTFTNVSSITIGAVASVGLHGIHNNATFNNNTGGQIKIDRATTSGILLNGGTFSNAATTTIGALVPMANLMTPGSGTFSNNTGGVLKGTGTLPAAAFTHAGGQLAPGYSPGKMTFDDAEDFSNSILAMEVAGGGGVAGTDFDQVVVAGTATLGGTLALSFNYPAPADGTQIMILDATSLSGTFSLVTGLSSGWAVNYDVPSAGKVSLVYTVALPVELTSFSARLSGRWVQLDWQTASEHHNAGFYIERSADGLRWSELGFVAGKGDATEAQHYSFPDETPLPGLNYYRLRQTDMDGKIEFSPVVSITVEGRGAGLSVFPNPVSQGVLTLRFSEKTSTEDLEVRLFNASGQLVKSITLNPENDLRINVSGLPPGAYALEVKNGRMRFCEKVMIE